jgi:hypothetical protein
MREGALRKCLRGITPRQWYLKLNGQVFLWVTGVRVQTLLSAKAYRNRKHTVITVDTAALMQKYAGQIVLSPINSGSTICNPRPRGKQTFLSTEDYPHEERRKLRGIANAVAEVAVRYAIPDLRDFVTCVEHRKNLVLRDNIFLHQHLPLRDAIEAATFPLFFPVSRGFGREEFARDYILRHTVLQFLSQERISSKTSTFPPTMRMWGARP